MDKFDKWMTVLITIFLGVSAIFMGLAQVNNSKATDIVLESLIDYENYKILMDLDLKQMTLTNSQLIVQNSMQINKNYACLGSILAERMEPFNRTLYDNITNECIYGNISSVESRLLENQNISSPIEKYNSRLEEVFEIRNKAFWQQMGSIVFFLLGMICFVIFIEKEIIESYFRRKNK